MLTREDPAPEYFSGLAGCLLALDEFSRASEAIDAGLKRYANDPELYYYRAWLNCKRYRFDDAHRDAEKAISLGANPARVNALFERR